MSIERTSPVAGANYPSIFTNLTGKLTKLIEQVIEYVKSFFQKWFPSLFNQRPSIQVSPAAPPSSPADGWETVRAGSISPRPVVEPGIHHSGTRNLNAAEYAASPFINLYALETFDSIFQRHQLPKHDRLDQVVEIGLKRHNNSSLRINEIIARSGKFKIKDLPQAHQILQAPIHLESQEAVENWIKTVYFAIEEFGQEVKGILLRGDPEKPRTFAIWVDPKEKPNEKGDKCDIYLLDPCGKDEASPISIHQFKQSSSFCSYLSKILVPFSEHHSEENYYWVKALEVVPSRRESGGQ